MNSWPNFFVIGAGKSGTTSIYNYLKQHPQIFMSPVKEPKYFAATARKLEFNGPGDERVVAETVTSESRYLDLFAAARDEPYRGEASTIYLSCQGTAHNMAKRVPDAKLVAILRHPADRAYSAFMHLRRDGFESLDSFQDALDAENERIRQGYYFHWHLRSRGYYGRSLKSWYSQFPAEQIRVFLYEDLLASSREVMAEIFRFLGVDDSFVPDTTAWHNQSGVPRNQSLQNFLTKSHPLKQMLKAFIPEQLGHRVISRLQPGLVSRPEIPARIRASLTEDFRDDILLLQDLIRRDLSHWLQEH